VAAGTLEGLLGTAGVTVGTLEGLLGTAGVTVGPLGTAGLADPPPLEWCVIVDVVVG
jgi:hypothetical protein